MRSYELWKKAFFSLLFQTLLLMSEHLVSWVFIVFFQNCILNNWSRKGIFQDAQGCFFFFKEKLLKRELHEWEQVCNYCMRSLKQALNTFLKKKFNKLRDIYMFVIRGITASPRPSLRHPTLYQRQSSPTFLKFLFLYSYFHSTSWRHFIQIPHPSAIKLVPLPLALHDTQPATNPASQVLMKQTH